MLDVVRGELTLFNPLMFQHRCFIFNKQAHKNRWQESVKWLKATILKKKCLPLSIVFVAHPFQKADIGTIFEKLQFLPSYSKDSKRTVKRPREHLPSLFLSLFLIFQVFLCSKGSPAKPAPWGESLPYFVSYKWNAYLSLLSFVNWTKRCNYLL